MEELEEELAGCREELREQKEKEDHYSLVNYQLERTISDLGKNMRRRRRGCSGKNISLRKWSQNKRIIRNKQTGKYWLRTIDSL